MPPRQNSGQEQLEAIARGQDPAKVPRGASGTQSAPTSGSALEDPFNPKRLEPKIEQRKISPPQKTAGPASVQAPLHPPTSTFKEAGSAPKQVPEQQPKLQTETKTGLVPPRPTSVPPDKAKPDQRQPAGLGQGTVPPTGVSKELELLAHGQKSLEPSKTEQRKISPEKMPAPTTKGLHTFMCGTPPSQYPCPSTIGSGSPSRSENTKPDASATDTRRVDPFAPPTPEQLAAIRAKELAEENRRWKEKAATRVETKEEEVCPRVVNIARRWFGCIKPGGGYGMPCRVCTSSRTCGPGHLGIGLKCTDWDQGSCGDAYCK